MDRNALEAGLVRLPDRYPHGSCHQYLWKRGPPWLSRSMVESVVERLSGTDGFDPRTYVAALRVVSIPGLWELVDRTLASREPAPLVEMDDLVRAATVHICRWLARNAANADGGPVGIVVASAITTSDRVAAARAADPEREVRVSRQCRCTWDLPEAGFLRSLCGLPARQVAERIGVSRSTAQERAKLHNR